MEIKIQNYYWFSNSVDSEGKHGNVFSGSVGTNSDRGFMNDKTFEYRVHLTMNDEKIVFIVESWFLPPWSGDNGKEKTDIETVFFDNEEESIEKIENYLDNRITCL